MRASPQSPAYTPHFDSTPVRGAKKIFRAGSGSDAEHIEFCWIGDVDHLDLSMPHTVTTGGAFTEIAVAFKNPAAITFRILVNSVDSGTVNTSSSLDLQLFAATLILVRDDLVQLDLTNFGTGSGTGLGVVFRNTV